MNRTLEILLYCVCTTLGGALGAADSAIVTGATNTVVASAPAITRTWTNRVEMIASIISTSAKPGACPECGQPNHHAIQVAYMSAFDQVYCTVVYQGRTNEMMVGSGPVTNWVSTNVVYRGAPQSPGMWQHVPPMPPSTNR